MTKKIQTFYLYYVTQETYTAVEQNVSTGSNS